MDRTRRGKPGQEEGVEREGENGKGKGKEKAKDTAQTDEYEDVVPTEDAGAGAGPDGMHGIPGSHLPAAGSAGDILRPLSEVAALFPSSGSLAWLATQHADRGQNYGSRINNDDGDSLTHAQSDSNVDATVDALRDFVAAVWQSPPPSASSGSSGRQGQGQGQGQDQDPYQYQYQYQYQENAPSPFAAVFPEGTSTSPLFLQRCDQRCDESETQPEPGTVLKYSESMQFFRRRPEDGGKIWKRRVLEYR